MIKKFIAAVKKRSGYFVVALALALVCVVLWVAERMGISGNLLKLLGIVLSPAVVFVGFAVWFVRKYHEPIRKFLENLRELSIRGMSARTGDEDSTIDETEGNIPNSDKTKTNKAEGADLFRRGLRYVREGREKEAIDMYRAAAEKQYAPAQNTLGARYARGDGVDEDQEEAVKWFHLAAENKNPYPRAQNNLGVRYAKGRGVREDQEEAAKWYHRAAMQGLATAQDNYADLCAVNACVWYSLAAENPRFEWVKQQEAARRRDEIYRTLSVDGRNKVGREIIRLRSSIVNGGAD